MSVEDDGSRYLVLVRDGTRVHAVAVDADKDFAWRVARAHRAEGRPVSIMRTDCNPPVCVVDEQAELG